MAQAGIVVPISGPYVTTWNALAIGTCSDDGFELQVEFPGQEIRETDAYGMTLVEAIYRGQNWRCRFRALEWKAGDLSILKSPGTQGTASDGLLNPLLTNIGARWTTLGQSLLMTAILSNPPTVPQTLTALSTILAPNSRSNFLFTSKMRELPLEVCLLPYLVGGSGSTVVPFTVT